MYCFDPTFWSETESSRDTSISSSTFGIGWCSVTDKLRLFD